MELALGAMASLAPKLGELLKEEYDVQKGLKTDIESISKELLMMKASLKDSSQLPPDQLSEVDKLWARQLRELSYDIEDIVDDFIMRVDDGGKSAATTTDAKVKEILGKATATMKKFKDRHKISEKVKDIKKLSKELAELHANYTVRGAGANLAASTGVDPRVINLYKTESDLVGLEESRDKVIKMLSIETKDDALAPASEQSLRIVPIVGVGGLGKTTLAKVVHDMVKKQFSCSAFISVGRTPTLTRTFEKMLMELDKKYKQVDMARWDIEQFRNELYKFLEQKRYFIVIDDVWDKGSWETIKYALEDNKCGSRIIMTTRNYEVLTKAEEPYTLKPLSDENSKKLFFKRIQGQEGESLDGVSSELSSKIIDKCGGIPLAIIAIASLLLERPYEEWSKVYDSIGFENGDNTSKILSYSYYDLPSYLKPCLLYLSKFPEDSINEIKSVIWMWIGEGFVNPEKEKGLFEVGERYFMELVNRSMILPLEYTNFGYTQFFLIHDIVFDFIRKLSGIENFVTLLDSREQHASLDTSRNEKESDVPSLDSKVRRLAMQNHNVKCFPKDTMDMPKVLRSLYIAHSKIGIMAPLHRFRVCRVLHLQESHVPISLKHIERLLHLKYLDISDTAIDELPRELGHLKSLLTLVLINIGLEELPPAVCSLTRLMCLVAVGFKRFPTDRMGNLTSLEELRLESVDGRGATEDLVVVLGKLTRLRVVKIIFLVELEESMQKALVQSLCNLHELQELQLYCKGSPEDRATVWEKWEPKKLWCLVIRGILFSRLPRWINCSSLPRLYLLSLTVYVVQVHDLDNLARLPELAHLELGGFSWPPGYIVGKDDFRNLRGCQVGTTFKFHKDATPRLEELQFIVYAWYFNWEVDGMLFEQFPTMDAFEDLDLGLDNLLSLEHVTISVDCSGATAAEVKELEAMVTRSLESHPNRPTMKVGRKYEENVFSDERHEAMLLTHIEQRFGVHEWKDEPDARFIGHLRWYRHLEKVVISIDCVGASICEVEKVEEAFRNAAEVHPNRPTIQLIRTTIDDTETHIEGHFRVLEWKDEDEPADVLISILQLYQRLEGAVISIDCAGASMREVEKLKAAFRHVPEAHRNHPTIKLIRTNTDKMVSSTDHPDTELMCLIAEGFQRFPTDKMGNLISLEELRLKNVVGRSATEDLVVELGKQTRLRVVTITFSEELEECLQKSLLQSLCNLQELQKLELSFTRLSQQGVKVWEEDWEAPKKLQRLVIGGITFSRLPRWINCSRLPLLCLLSLRVYIVEVLDLDNLGSLPDLSYLDLDGYNWPPGYTVGTDGFRNLRFCHVGTTLKFHMGSMPRLEELKFIVHVGHWSGEINGLLLEQLPTKYVFERLDLGLDNLLSLRRVNIFISCIGATAAEVQEVEAMVTRAVDNHPNRPTTQMNRLREDNILSNDEVREIERATELYCIVLESKDKPDAHFIVYLWSYRRLTKAVISIDCAGASMCEVEKVEAAFRHSAELHPNNPTIELIRINTNEMVSSSDHPDIELDHDHMIQTGAFGSLHPT